MRRPRQSNQKNRKPGPFTLRKWIKEQKRTLAFDGLFSRELMLEKF